MLLRQLVSKNADRSESGVGTTEYSAYEVFVLLVGHISIAEPNHVQIVIKWQNWFPLDSLFYGVFRYILCTKDTCRHRSNVFSRP